MSICHVQRLSIIGLVSILSACGGGASSEPSAQTVKISIQNEAPLSACSSGGITINSGVDTNNDFVLQNTEITGSQYVCNGDNGAAGAIGSVGPTGSPGSVGLTGINGTNGLAGTSGLTALVVVADELPGINCTQGGSQVRAGIDANHDQVLATSEVTSSNFICHGANGLEGASGASGTNGTNGTNGAMGASGTNGATGATGATGASGFKALVAIVTELPSIHCLTGGVVAQSGVDSNSNNALDTLEVTSTTYICNGARGATGATGAAGVDGARGDTGPAGGISAYGYIYALNRQDVAIDAAVLFDAQSDLLNIEHQLDSSDISILQDGNYLVSFSITGTEPNQFAIFVNGAVVPGSIYGSGAGTQQNHGQVIVSLREKDTLTLVNYHSAAAVGLQSNSGGTEKNVVASVTLLKLNEVIR